MINSIIDTSKATEDNKIAEANNTNIESGLYKNVTLGCTSREDADLLSNYKASKNYEVIKEETKKIKLEQVNA